MQGLYLSPNSPQLTSSLRNQKLLLPRLERSCSPRGPNRTPNGRISRSEKLLLPTLKYSSSRNSKGCKSEIFSSSSTRCGVVYGYGARSYKGLARYRKFERASIILNIPKPQTIEENIWPRSSFFGLYDGHSGSTCSDFLKENLHSLIFKDANFPFKAKISIETAFQEAEHRFLQEAEEKGDMSGSCALVTLIIGNRCLIANAGHSRVIVSIEKGKKVKCLNKVHKPGIAEESERIIQAGGKLYTDYLINHKGVAVSQGSIKVIPGKLQVSRAFGNLDAKLERFGGNPNVVIVSPDITTFKITNEFDFFLIANDAFFETISYKEAVDFVWVSLNELKAEDLSTQINGALEDLTNEVYRRKVERNVTLVLVVFKNLRDNNEAENT